MATELVIFVGLQGAGKSTFYRERFSATHAYVSKDQFPNHHQPARRQARLIQQALEAGQSVVVDNTNPTPEVRAEIIALGRAHGAEIVGYYFDSPVRESLARNAQRAGKARVPPVAIYATARRLVPPTYAEGFDRLHTIRIAAGGRFEEA